jgi:hypothetical protein
VRELSILKVIAHMFHSLNSCLSSLLVWRVGFQLTSSGTVDVLGADQRVLSRRRMKCVLNTRLAIIEFGFAKFSLA